jgi:hypothetical protein
LRDCLNLDGLRGCVTNITYGGVFKLVVAVPGRVRPTLVEIGLAGNGMVARTILYSLRPASASAATTVSARCKIDLATRGRKVAMPAPVIARRAIKLPGGYEVLPPPNHYRSGVSASVAWYRMQLGNKEPTAFYHLLLGRLVGHPGVDWVLWVDNYAGVNRDTGGCVLVRVIIAASASSGRVLWAASV